MKEIVIKIDDKIYNDILVHRIYCSPRNVPYEAFKAIRDGKVLPKGHGRLIDADAFIEFLKHKKYGMIDYSDCVIDDITEDAPTIIEADKGDTE